MIFPTLKTNRTDEVLATAIELAKKANDYVCVTIQHMASIYQCDGDVKTRVVVHKDMDVEEAKRCFARNRNTKILVEAHFVPSPATELNGQWKVEAINRAIEANMILNVSLSTGEKVTVYPWTTSEEITWLFSNN